MRQAIRVTAVWIIGILEVLCIVVALMTWNAPEAAFGWNLGSDGLTVINVEPNMPAAKAGIAPGDRIVYASMPVLGRTDTLMAEPVYPGVTISFRILRGDVERQVTMEAQSLPPISAFAHLAYELGGLALGLVALVLVALRPSAMTWGFAAVAPPLVIPDAVYMWFQRAPFEQAFAFHLALSALYALQFLGIIVFACRFPTGNAAGFSKVASRAAVPLSIVVLGIYWYVDYAIFVSKSPPPHWMLLINDYGTTVFGALLALAAMFSNYAAEQRANRSRLVPVIAAFVLLNLSVLIDELIAEIRSDPLVVGSADLLFAASAALLAAAIAYGVVRHRVIDVSFIISRTIVYTILTVFVVAIFSLIEYIFGKVLEHQGVATFLEMAAAIGLGLSLNVLHGKLDSLIDRTIFRKRHLAEKRLEAASHTLPHATSSELVNEMLVAEPVDALELASAAIFRRNGTSFKRESAAGWSTGDVAELEENDQLVARLRAELQPVTVSDVRWPRENIPSGVAQPIYAVPIASGHKLSAIALYGGHAGGEDLDPDERRSLRGLAAGAALAYDHLAAEELNRKVEELRGENEALRQSQELLVEKVLKRLE